MDRYQNLTFSEHAHKMFRLETRQDSTGKQHLTLYHGETDEPIPNVLQPTLRFLRCLALEAPDKVSNNDVIKAIWPKATSTIIDTHVNHLRAALNDSKDNPKLIEVIRGFGHRLMVPVVMEGDLGGVEFYPEWRINIFDEFMRGIKRSDDKFADLRILATAFSGSVVDLKLPALIKRRVRIRILMMDAENSALTNGRFLCRTDKAPAEALHELIVQIGQIRDMAAEHKNVPSDPDAGWLEMKLSELIPCGFVALSSDRALLGIYPAQCSYTLGPMLDVRGDTDLWRLLLNDWKARWPENEA